MSDTFGDESPVFVLKTVLTALRHMLERQGHSLYALTYLHDCLLALE